MRTQARFLLFQDVGHCDMKRSSKNRRSNSQLPAALMCRLQSHGQIGQIATVFLKDLKKKAGQTDSLPYRRNAESLCPPLLSVGTKSDGFVKQQGRPDQTFSDCGTKNATYRVNEGHKPQSRSGKMRHLNSSAYILLVITLLIPNSSLSQSGGSSQKQTPSAQREALPAAVEQLLRQRPLASESAVGVRLESGPPADDAPIDDLIEYWSNRK